MRFKTCLCALLLSVPPIAFAEVYRCDKAGRVVYSDAPCEGKVTQLNILQYPKSAQPATSIGLLEIMDAAERERDSVKRAELASQVHQLFAQYKASAHSDAARKAEKDIGITSLEEQLSDSEKLDRASPSYGDYRSDSPSTAAVRQRLLQAKSQLDPAIARRLRSDGDYLRILSRYERFDRR